MTGTPPGPRLSIIIPTLDEERTVVELLADLAPLRRQGHELLLVDGGSRDRTSEVARPLVDRLLESPPSRAGQMNAGAAVASGEVLWFLHADTRVAAQAAVQRLSASVTGGSHWGRFDVRLSGRHRMLRIIERMMNWRSWITGIATGDQGIFVTRAAFDAVSGFPEVPLMEDIAISRVLRRIGRPARIRSPRLQTSSRRWEERGVVATMLLMWRLRLAYALGTSPHELAKRYR